MPAALLPLIVCGRLAARHNPGPGRPKFLTRHHGRSPNTWHRLNALPCQGFETTSHAITWTLAALAAHPPVQARLAAELALAGLAPARERPVPRAFEWADANRLPYLGAVIRESLRLFSPASLGTTRIADKEVEVGTARGRVGALGGAAAATSGLLATGPVG
jgi:hypothetical protein